MVIRHKDGLNLFFSSDNSHVAFLSHHIYIHFVNVANVASYASLTWTKYSLGTKKKKYKSHAARQH